MITPKPYLSFSQMTLFEKSPDIYLQRYIYGEKQYVTKNMAYGSLLADGLKDEEATGDPLLDLMASKIPKFELMDQPIEDPKGIEIFFERDNKNIKVPVLTDKKITIPLLALPDTAKATYEAFKEYKTSVRKWTQKMADESGQITFYATAIWLAKGIIPSDIELDNLQVEYDEDGRLRPTENILRFPTKRTMIDVIKMTRRIKVAWAGIKQLVEKELL